MLLHLQANNSIFRVSVCHLPLRGFPLSAPVCGFHARLGNAMPLNAAMSLSLPQFSVQFFIAYFGELHVALRCAVHAYVASECLTIDKWPGGRQINDKLMKIKHLSGGVHI